MKNFDYEVLEIDSIKKYTSPGYVNDKINPKLKKSIRFYPHITKGEGQFACVLKKKGNLVKTKLDSKTNDFLDKYIKCDVDIKLNSEIYDNRCYTKLPFDIKGMKIISSGVKLGEIKNDRFIAVRWENFLGESAHDRSYGIKSGPDVNNAVGSQNHCSKTKYRIIYWVSTKMKRELSSINISWIGEEG